MASEGIQCVTGCISDSSGLRCALTRWKLLVSMRRLMVLLELPRGLSIGGHTFSGSVVGSKEYRLWCCPCFLNYLIIVYGCVVFREKVFIEHIRARCFDSNVSRPCTCCHNIAEELHFWLVIYVMDWYLVCIPENMCSELRARFLSWCWQVLEHIYRKGLEIFILAVVKFMDCIILWAFGKRHLGLWTVLRCWFGIIPARHLGKGGACISTVSLGRKSFQKAYGYFSRYVCKVSLPETLWLMKRD